MLSVGPILAHREVSVDLWFCFLIGDADIDLPIHLIVTYTHRVNVALPLKSNLTPPDDCTLSLPYRFDASECYIVPHQMCLFENCSNGHNMYSIEIFDYPDKAITTIHPTMRIVVPCRNHHHLCLSMRTQYTLLNRSASFRQCQYCVPG